MKTIWLLPSSAKWIGLALFTPLFIYFNFHNFLGIDLDLEIFKGEPFWITEQSGNSNFSDEILFSLLIVSLWMIGFSKIKVEDEQTASLRLNALYWGILAFHLVLLAELWLIYGVKFISALYYNLLTALILYTVRFYFLVWKQNREASHEE